MSIIKHPEQRVGIFIDAQNLYHSARNLFNRRVNFGEVVKSALAGRKLVRAIAYVITSEAGDEKAFFEALTQVGIETKTKDLQIFSSGAKKGDWDVGLAVDAIKMAPKLDTVIIVSGDGDFIPLVEYLQINEGCQVEVVSFGKSSSMNLKEITDDFLDLSEDPQRYLIGYSPRKQTAPANNQNPKTPKGVTPTAVQNALQEKPKPKGRNRRGRGGQKKTANGGETKKPNSK